jgi:hypothetical protein
MKTRFGLLLYSPPEAASATNVIDRAILSDQGGPFLGGEPLGRLGR